MTRTANAKSIHLNRVFYILSLGVLLGTGLSGAAEPQPSFGSAIIPVPRPAGPQSFFGSALITGANNRITVTRVPVIDSRGKVTYRDITIDFEVSSTGVLTL